MIFMFWYEDKLPYKPVHEKSNKIMFVLGKDTVLDQAPRLENFLHAQLNYIAQALPLTYFERDFSSILWLTG